MWGVKGLKKYFSSPELVLNTLGWKMVTFIRGNSQKLHNRKVTKLPLYVQINLIIVYYYIFWKLVETPPFPTIMKVSNNISYDMNQFVQNPTITDKVITKSRLYLYWLNLLQLKTQHISFPLK